MDVRHRDVLHIFQLCVSRYDICVKRTEPQRGSFSVIENPITRPHKIKIKPRTNVFIPCMHAGERFPPSYFSSLLLSPCLLPALMQSMFLFHQNPPPRQRRRRRRIVVAGPHGACLPSAAAAPLVASSTLIIIDGVVGGWSACAR